MLSQTEKTAMFNSIINGSGLTREELARKMGLTRAGLALKVTGKLGFWDKEIASMSKALELTKKQEDLLFFDRHEE